MRGLVAHLEHCYTGSTRRIGAAAFAHTGRVGEIVDVERHPGSFDIVHVKDGNDNTFATRKHNIFVIGRSQSDIRVALPKGKGIRAPLTQAVHVSGLQYTCVAAGP